MTTAGSFQSWADDGSWIGKSLESLPKIFLLVQKLALMEICGNLAAMKFRWILIWCVAFCAAASAAELKVVSLHPLIGDLLKQVGGDKIEVVDLIGAKGDPHSFEPRTEDIAAVSGAKVYFISGMGLEGYLPKLRSILPGRFASSRWVEPCPRCMELANMRGMTTITIMNSIRIGGIRWICSDARRRLWRRNCRKSCRRSVRRLNRMRPLTASSSMSWKNG